MYMYLLDDRGEAINGRFDSWKHENRTFNEEEIQLLRSNFFFFLHSALCFNHSFEFSIT